MADWVGEGGPYATDHLVTAAEFNGLRQPYYVNGTQIDVVSTAAFTSIFSLSIPGGTLGTDGLLRMTIGGDYLNNDGAGRTLTLSADFGGTAFYADTSASITNNATRREFMLQLHLANVTSTGFQVQFGRFTIGAIGATTGLGDMASVTQVVDVVFGGNTAKDTTSAQTLGVSVQHSASSANLSFRKLYSILEVLPG